MPFQLSNFRKRKELIHAFSTAEYGNMSFKWGSVDTVKQNRKKFLESSNVSIEDCATVSLVHGASIKYISKKDVCSALDNKDSEEADAMITSEKNVYLFILTADCLPILFYDPLKSVVALAHCGWKSTDQKLVSKVVGEMISVYHCDSSDIMVGIGPGIHKESYIFKECIQKTLPDWMPFLVDLPDGRTSVDIVAYNKQQLLDGGVKEENIEIMDVNTAKSPYFFSHYCATWEGVPEARFLTVIGMKPDNTLIDKYLQILKKEGFKHIYEWRDAPGVKYAAHKHMGEVSMYIAGGSITFYIDGKEVVLNAGDRFDVPVGKEHVAVVGLEGTHFVVGEMIEGDS